MLPSPLLLLLLQHPTPARAPQPRAGEVRTGGNVLVLVADDLGVDSLGLYGEGASPPRTPAIDALARSGVVFRNAWSAPICSPTRATIQTGRLGFRTGIGSHVGELAGAPALEPAEVTLPELVRAAPLPYASAAFGKWHLGNGDVGGALAANVAGYDHFAGSLGAIPDYHDWVKIVDGVATTEPSYATSATVDDALAWIATAPEPWLCHVAFHAPHKPFHAPPQHLHGVPLAGLPPPDVEPRPYYEAMVEALDTEIARLLARLGPDVLARTTVILVGDNGTPAEVTLPPFDPAHAKETLFEGGINVPLIVAAPDLPVRGVESAALVHTVDLFATVAQLAGVELDDAFPGLVHDSVGLLPYLEDPRRPSLRRTVVAELFHPNGLPAAPPPVCGGPASLPPVWVCGRDAGFQGPGAARLEVCAQRVRAVYEGELRLSGGPPHAAGWLVTSTAARPAAVLGATVLTPVLSLVPVATDAAGGLVEQVSGTATYTELFFQVLLLDPAQPQGYAASNAVAVPALEGDRKAIRDARYKWIVDSRTCEESFFDLQRDPFETRDLLLTSLSPAERAALGALRAELAALLEDAR